MAEYEYVLDRDDVLQWVSDTWLRFAEENEASGMRPELILGRSLWDFIGCAKTRYLYEHLFATARDDTRSVSVPFRCDAPGLRRFMRLKISPEDDHSLRILVRLEREEPRDPVEFLEPGDAQPHELMKMCSWCRRVRSGEEWKEVEEVIANRRLFKGDPLPAISHGVCPDCFDGVLET